MTGKPTVVILQSISPKAELKGRSCQKNELVTNKQDVGGRRKDVPDVREWTSFQMGRCILQDQKVAEEDIMQEVESGLESKMGSKKRCLLMMQKVLWKQKEDFQESNLKQRTQEDLPYSKLCLRLILYKSCTLNADRKINKHLECVSGTISSIAVCEMSCSHIGYLIISTQHYLLLKPAVQELL